MLIRIKQTDTMKTSCYHFVAFSIQKVRYKRTERRITLSVSRLGLDLRYSPRKRAILGGLKMLMPQPQQRTRPADVGDSIGDAPINAALFEQTTIAWNALLLLL